MKTTPLLCAVSLLALFTPAAMAQIDDKSDDVVATANHQELRELQTLTTAAFGVGIGAEQISGVNAFNVEDNFKYAPNINVRKRFIGDNNATLSFRGSHSFQTPRALVSVDGFTISNFIGASFDTAPKWGVIAPDDVDRVDIIYGPTSARYSGNGTGGTLRLQTKPIEETQFRAKAQLFQQNYDFYNTDLTLNGGSIDLGADFVVTDKASLSISYRHFENEGQPQQWRTLNRGLNSDDFVGVFVDNGLGFPLVIAAEDSVIESTEDQFRLRGTYDFGNGWTGRALAALLIDEEDASNPSSYLTDSDGIETFENVSGVRQDLSNDTELLIGAGLSGDISGWSVDLSVSRYDVLDSEDRQSDNLTGRLADAPLTGFITDNSDTAWNSVEAIAEKTLGQQALAFGVSYADYTFETPRFATTDWRNGENGTLQDSSGGDSSLLGVFVEDQISLDNRWTATVGLRAERWEADNGFLINGGTRVDYDSRSETALSPKAALSFAPNDSWEFTASASKASRFPTVQELYQASLIEFGANVGDLNFGSFDPDLKAEDVTDFQLIATKRFDRAAFTVTAFRQDIDDTLFTQTVPELGTSLTTNIDNVTTDGVDFLLNTDDLLIDGLSLDANLSLLDARIERNAIDTSLEGNRFPRVPDVRANMSVRYRPNEDWLLAAGWRYQDTPDRNIENTSNSVCQTYFCVSNFSVVDVKATRRFGDIDVSLGVDNLNDNRAFVFHPLPGRTALFEISWKGSL